jgi:hypothetical protein
VRAREKFEEEGRALDAVETFRAAREPQQTRVVARARGECERVRLHPTARPPRHDDAVEDDRLALHSALARHRDRAPAPESPHHVRRKVGRFTKSRQPLVNDDGRAPARRRAPTLRVRRRLRRDDKDERERGCHQQSDESREATRVNGSAREVLTTRGDEWRHGAFLLQLG